MNTPCIRAAGLSKEYVIGSRKASRNTFREMLVNTAGAPLRWLREGRARMDDTCFLALSDVSFEVQPGEIMGVIGRNGAGKSTLLKILSRITAPTKGRVEIRGRIASLLEVGTGFHTELTGRENIRLNGAIIGMSGAEITRKFDQIVAFSGVEKFIDTPVKHYSSGMYMRLAFAVAAHLEPEILLIDEVLAVGDAEFQNKCLGKMSEIAGHGRTVVFVSHNMSAVNVLCQSAILLDEGRVVFRGPATEAITRYTDQFQKGADVVVEHRPRSGPYLSQAGLASARIAFGDTLTLACTIKSPEKRRAAVEIEIHDDMGLKIIYASTAPMSGEEFDLEPGTNHLAFKIGPLPLARGRYKLTVWLIKPWIEEFHHLTEPIEFEVTHSDPGRAGFDFQQAFGRGCVAVPICRVGEGP